MRFVLPLFACLIGCDTPVESAPSAEPLQDASPNWEVAAAQQPALEAEDPEPDCPTDVNLNIADCEVRGAYAYAGQPQFTISHHYDHRGLYIRYANHGLDGQQLYQNFLSYDADDRLVEVEEDTDGDWAIDSRELRTYRDYCDAAAVSFDADFDGIFDAGEDRDFDGAGRFVSAVGWPDPWALHRELDESGRLVREGFDGDGDGVHDASWTYTYDTHGRRTEARYDAGHDGSTDAIYTTVWNADDRVVQEIEDHDADGIADEVTTHTWDGDRYQTTSIDLGGDGSEDAYVDWTWECH